MCASEVRARHRALALNGQGLAKVGNLSYSRNFCEYPLLGVLLFLRSNIEECTFSEKDDVLLKCARDIARSR